VRERWASADPLTLIGVWALATGASIAWVATIPGRPQYREGGGQLEIAMAGGLLILFFMVRGSRTAWRIAQFAAIFGVLAAAFGWIVGPTGLDFEPKFLALLALQAVAIGALTSPSVARHVSRPRRRRR
jgi:hypothetical protein